MAAAIRVLQLSKRLRQHPLLGYATAIASVGLACLLQWAFESAYGGAPFLTIYPAVILTTLVGGLGAGALSAILAGLSQWAFFIPTLHWFAVVTYVFDATVAVLLIVFINRTLTCSSPASTSRSRPSSTSIFWRPNCITASKICSR